MADGAFVVLLQNAALLLAMALIAELVVEQRRLAPPALWPLIEGVLVGALGIAVMLTPWHVLPGVGLDTRSVLLGVTGLLLAPLSTVIAMVVTAAFRIWEGGSGAISGIALILVSGGIGLAWGRVRRRQLPDLSIRELYLFGVVIHVAIVPVLLLLPSPAEVLRAVALPILTILPVATALLGALIVDRRRRRRTRQALHDSEQRLRLAFDAAQLGFYDLDLRTGRATANDLYARMLGHDPAGFRLDLAEWGEALHPDDGPRVMAVLAECTSGRQADYAVDYRQRTQSGGWAWLRSQGRVVEWDAAGAPVRLIGVHEDITARRAAEQAVQAASEEAARALDTETRSRRALLSVVEDLQAAVAQVRRLAEALDHVPDHIYMKDAQRRYIYANRPTLEAYGVSAEALVGSDDTRFFPADVAAHLGAVDDRVLEQGEQTDEEIEFVAEGGVRRVYREVKAPLRAQAGDGEPWGLIGLSTDITERRKADDALRASETHYRALVEGTPGIVYSYSLERGGIYYSSHTLSVLGYPPEYLLTQPMLWNHAIHPDDRGAVDEALRATADGTMYHVQYRIQDAAGRWLWLDDRAFRLEVKGTDVVVEGLASDITERRQAEAEVNRLNEDLEQRVIERTEKVEAANRELKSFSYSVSHDLRAPLRAVAGFADLLNRRYRDRLDDTGAHFLDNILVGSEHMGVLIDELLDYSRLGRGLVRSEPVPLAPVTEQLRVTFAARMEVASAALVVEEPLATPTGDPILIEQIIANLVDNALTYRRLDVPPAVTISARRHGATVTIAVADNGIGIPPEYHERIFEVFARLHGEDEYPGTGIGLATVRKAARLMGSDVTLESVVGEGTTFRFDLPAAPGEGRSA